MKQHRIFRSDLFWVLVSLVFSFMLLLLVFRTNMFSGTFEIVDGNDGFLRFPRLQTSILVIVFICFLVFDLKNRYPAFATRLGAVIARVTGLGFICMAAMVDLVMVLFTLSTATYSGTRFGEVLTPFMPDVLVIGVLTLSIAVVLLLLFRSASGRNSSIA